MTLRHLEIYAEVCKTLSMTKAAENLDLAQPAVSNVIKELEKYYETKLFDRISRKLYITDAGQQLLFYTNNILAQINESRDVLRDQNRYTQVRIGASVAFGFSAMSPLMKAFRKNHPEIPLYIEIQNAHMVEQDLLNYKLDIGLMDTPSHHNDFISIPIASDPIIVVAAADHPIDTNIDAFALKDEPLLVREPGSSSHRAVEKLQNMIGNKMNIVMESVIHKCLLDACINGMGVLFVSKTIAKPHIDAGLLKEIHLSSVHFDRKYYFVYRKTKYLSNSMRSFLQFIQNSLENIDSYFN